MAAVDVLDLLKEQVLLGGLPPELVRRLAARLPGELAAGPASSVDGRQDPPPPAGDPEDRLLQALDGVTQRLRFALAEYDEPPGSVRPEA